MILETNQVRIISNTTNPEDEEKNKMIGEEYEIEASNFCNDIVKIYPKNKEVARTFNKSDVRFLTPMKFGDRHIAIGDWVKVDDVWNKVVSFAPGESEELLVIGSKNGLVVDFSTEEQIQDHDSGIETDEYIEIKHEIPGKTIYWGEEAPREMNWYEAKEWCEEQGGRLPTRLELLQAYEDVEDICKKMEEAIEAKNSILRNLKYSLAHATKAYNDAIRVYEAKLVEFGIPAEELGLELLETNTSNMPAGLVAA